MSTDAVTAATTRLTLSRMRLHKAMEAHHDHTNTTWLWGHHAPDWVAQLKESPEVQLLWENAKPLLKNKSVVLAAAAVVFGCVLVWSRPRRWLLQPAVMAALLPYLLSHLGARAPQTPPPSS